MVATATANGSMTGAGASLNAPRNASLLTAGSRSKRPSSKGDSTSNRPQ